MSKNSRPQGRTHRLIYKLAPACALGILPLSQLQAQPLPAPATNTAPPIRAVTLNSDTLKIGVGERVLLPITGVTRIITDDDEVARAFFQEGAPVLQGVTPGATIVEIYQASGTPRVLTVQVAESGETTPNEPIITVPTPEAPPIIPVTPTNDPTTITPIAPSKSALSISLSAKAYADNPSQTEFTISYANGGQSPAQDAKVRFALDERVSYVPDSASQGGKFDPATREVTWDLDRVPANSTGGKLTLRVEPVERGSFTFDSVATIEEASLGPISSARVSYNTVTTPLMTVFALPDRFLAGKNGSTLVDVRGSEFQSAVDRLQQLGIVTGKSKGFYYPKEPAQRAEYAVMTINGLNLRDLRDITQLKFVLGRRSTVNLVIQNSAGKTVAELIRGATFDAGEHTAIWNGRTANGFAPAGRYTYVCTARDAKGATTTLRGNLTLVSLKPLEGAGLPSFIDVKPTDWYARFLAIGEKQGLILGYTDKTFRPKQPISRVEATAIVVRALGLEDVSRQWADKDVGFTDYSTIPPWARGYVNVATTLAKTSAGKTLMRGYPNNRFEPDANLRRDQAALIVQRVIDREMTRTVSVSGAIAPGAVISINSKSVSPDGNGQFSFDMDLNTSVPTTVAVVDSRGR